MSQLVARLLLAVMIFPLSILLLVTLAAGSSLLVGSPSVFLFISIWLLVNAFIGAYWIWLWRDLVRWTEQRRFRTMLVTFLSVGTGALVGVLISLLPDREADFFGAVFGGAVVPILWVFCTILVWRESAQERMERVRRESAGTVSCPVCGYNLTGLREARCPECGAQFTLEDLIAAHNEPEMDHGPRVDRERGAALHASRGPRIPAPSAADSSVQSSGSPPQPVPSTVRR